ncbi:MAG: glycosyltransferase family 2 protein [Candidatus Krumholzibacteriota bacterium]|nr:glycosyltransferase family 2 protein [Candidatus Krumholzibacteriota bacterium]
MAPAVSIVVPCRNERAHVAAFLESLVAQEPVPGGVEILVADGLSDDGTAELLAEHARRRPELRVIPNAGRIVSTGLNAAVRAARGRYIVRMDVHTRYAPDYVRRCVETIEATGADNVGGPARTEAAGAWQRAIAAAYASPFAVGGARFHFADYEGEVDTVTYGCWERATLERLGLFDEGLVRNQDDELNLRLRRAGGRVWQSPAIRSWYRPRVSLGRLFRQYYQYGFWKVAVIRKHRLPASPRHLVPVAFVSTMAVLGAAALFWALARVLFCLECAAYLGFLVLGSLAIARRRGWGLLPLLPPTLAAFHVSYGLGFLHGLAAAERGGRAAQDLTR